MYNFDITSISYDSDEEYRYTIRTLFNFVGNDDDDNDEINDTQMANVLDWIYLKTKENPLFQIVYVKAASFMISENPETGLVVLFAFDYLPLFHQMLLAFHTLDDKFDETHVSYVNLHKKLFS
jgi:hypothetical protein